MKNGILFFNTINSNKLGIFGFNETKGNFEEYNILSNIKKKKSDTNDTISNFTLKIKLNVVYVLLGNILYRQKIFDLNCLYKGVYKLQFIDNQKKSDSNDRKFSMAETNAIQ